MRIRYLDLDTLRPDRLGRYGYGRSAAFHADPRHPGELPDRPAVCRMVAGYDCGIRHMDEPIERVFAALAGKGVFDDQVAIISSDHGENMGELGIYGEHATADHATRRAPLILRWPGVVRPGQVETGLQYSLDHVCGPWREYAERLERTGRSAGAAELRRSHPREFQGGGL